MLDFPVKTLVDEIAVKYPPDMLKTLLADAIKDALVGRTVTVEFKDGAMKVSVG